VCQVGSSGSLRSHFNLLAKIELTGKVSHRFFISIK
jgi:hypothetical protein